MGARLDALKSWATRPELTNLKFSSEVQEALVSGGSKVAWRGGRVALAAAAVVGGIYAAASLVGAMRKHREFKEPELPLGELPTPFMSDVPAMAAAGYGQDTMMGMQPVEGEHARRIRAARGGMAAGVDPSNPAIERDGHSSIDGRPVQNLGSVGF